MIESIIKKIFNKGTFKFIAALSIPACFVYFWYYSKDQARLEMASYDKEQKENPLQDLVRIENYVLKEVDDSNSVRWQLVAKSGIMHPDTKDVDLEQVLVEYFDGPVLKMRLKAPIGLANENTRKIKLDADKVARVIAEGGEGKGTMVAAKVELSKKNQFAATGDVNIVMPGVAKVRANSARGSFGGTGIKDLRVIGNTHSVVNM